MRPGLLVCPLGELVADRAVMERCRDIADPVCRPVSVGMNEDPYVATLGNLAVTLALLVISIKHVRLSEARSESRGGNAVGVP